MRNLAILAAITLAFIMALAVWPTRYRHDQIKAGQTTVLIRTDRFTGEAQYFDARTGWTTAKARGVLDQSTLDLLAPLPAK